MNFNYHTEHHLYPTLPWHQLPELAELTQKALTDDHYNYDLGHDWIMRSRKKSIKSVMSRAEDRAFTNTAA